MQIFKYKLEPYYHTIFKFNIPKHAKILTVQLQNDIICLWVLCNSDDTDNYRTFLIYGTDTVIHPENYHMEYIGSVQQYTSICHVFEKITSEKNKC